MDTPTNQSIIIAQKIHELAEKLMISIVGTTKGHVGRGHESGYNNPGEVVDRAYSYARVFVERRMGPAPMSHDQPGCETPLPTREDLVLKLECLRRLVTALRDIQIRETKKGMKWVTIDSIESAMDVLLQIINDLMSEQVPLDDFISFIERRLPEFSIPTVKGQS